MSQETWVQIADVVSAALLISGALLALVAAIGMVRLLDLLSRMHAATKPQVLGMILVMSGLALRLREPSALGAIALVVLFQMLTSPVAGHMVGRSSFRARQMHTELLVVDELSETLEDGKSEPRGAP